MEKDEALYEKARQVAKNKVAFIRNFIIFIVVLALLAAFNNLTSGDYQWWLWIALFWGIGLIFNFLKAFLFRGGGLERLEERLTRQEIERIGDEK